MIIKGKKNKRRIKAYNIPTSEEVKDELNQKGIKDKQIEHGENKSSLKQGLGIEDLEEIKGLSPTKTPKKRTESSGEIKYPGGPRGWHKKPPREPK